MFRLRESGPEDLPGHARIPISFLVNSVLEPRIGGDALDLVLRPHPAPWVKDYDAVEGASPALWSIRFDTSSWRVISAWEGETRLGGIVLIAGDPSLDMLEGRSDLALIWDLRIGPEARGRGIGARLVSAAVQWAQQHGCRELKAETQNVNVGACRFYERQGFAIRAVRPGAYPGLPDEIQLLLYRNVV